MQEFDKRSGGPFERKESEKRRLGEQKVERRLLKDKEQQKQVLEIQETILDEQTKILEELEKRRLEEKEYGRRQLKKKEFDKRRLDEKEERVL